MTAPSLRQCINAKCKDCIYDVHSGLGAWRMQVTACTAVRCPLWPVRPTSKPRVRGTGVQPAALASYRDARRRLEIP